MVQIYSPNPIPVLRNDALHVQNAYTSVAKFITLAQNFATYMEMYTETPQFKPKEFGHRVKNLRETARIKQQDFAESLGVSKRTLLEIEAGRGEISLSKAYKAAELLQVTINKLLDLPDATIVNSFNNIQQESSHLFLQNSKIEADRDHIATLNRLTNLQDQVK